MFLSSKSLCCSSATEPAKWAPIQNDSSIGLLGNLSGIFFLVFVNLPVTDIVIESSFTIRLLFVIIPLFKINLNLLFHVPEFKIVPVIFDKSTESVFDAFSFLLTIPKNVFIVPVAELLIKL